jgi:hypothetical protein
MAAVFMDNTAKSQALTALSSIIAMIVSNM